MIELYLILRKHSSNTCQLLFYLETNSYQTCFCFCFTQKKKNYNNKKQKTKNVIEQAYENILVLLQMKSQTEYG